MKVATEKFRTELQKKWLNALKENDFISINKCRFCGGTLSVLGIFRKQPLIHHVICKNCCAISYDKILKQDKLDEWYAGYYADIGDKSDENKHITFFGVNRFAKRLKKIVENSIKFNSVNEEVSILDFGGGDGAIAYAFSKEIKNKYKKISITVVDYNNSLYKSNDENIAMAHVDSVYHIVDSQKYNIIIASAILEHLPNLHEDFNWLKKHLASGGLLYIRTPYCYPLFKALRKIGIEYDVVFPDHIWDLGAKFYDRLEDDKLKLIISRPSIVETTFKSNFFQTLAAYILKAPGYFFKNWPFAVGWEAVFIKRKDK